MAWIAFFLVLAFLVVLYFAILRPGKLGFWKVAAKYPDLAYEFFQGSQSWQVFLEEPEGGYKASLPPGTWHGPFRLAVPQHNWKVITILGKVADYEAEQDTFVERVEAAS